MNIEIVKSSKEFTPSITYVVGGNNSNYDTLQEALDAASTLRNVSCLISIEKDIDETNLTLTDSVIPIVIRGNGHSISSYKTITPNNGILHVEQMPFSLLIDGVLHTPSSTAKLSSLSDFYELGGSVGEIDGTTSSSSCKLPCNYSSALMNTEQSKECSFVQMFHKWMGEWLPVTSYELNEEDNSKLSSVTGVMTYCSYHLYQNHSADSRQSYRLVNVVSNEEYYFTRNIEGGYDIHIPFPYTEVKYTTAENVILLNNVCNVKFENVKFTGSHTDLKLYAQGEGNQSAAVLVKDSSNIVFYGCEWTGCENYALQSENVELMKVVNCYIHDTLSGGIRTILTNYLTIHNTCIKNYGELWVGALGCNIRTGHDIRFSNNSIVSGYYTGLSVGWQWGYSRNTTSQENTTYNLLFIRNHIHSIMKHVLSDGGGIYTLGPLKNTMFIQNNIHDIYSQTGSGACGMYFDEGSQFISFTQNLIYSSEILLNSHYGLSNIVEENILYYPTYTVFSQAIPSPCPYLAYHNIVNQGNVYAFKTGSSAGASEDIDIIGNVFKYVPFINFSSGRRKMYNNEGIFYSDIDSHFTNPAHGDFTPLVKSHTFTFGDYSVTWNSNATNSPSAFCYTSWLKGTIGITDSGNNRRDVINEEYHYSYVDGEGNIISHIYDIINLHKQIELTRKGIHNDYLDSVTYIR